MEMTKRNLEEKLGIKIQVIVKMVHNERTHSSQRRTQKFKVKATTDYNNIVDIKI